MDTGHSDKADDSAVTAGALAAVSRQVHTRSCAMGDGFAPALPLLEVLSPEDFKNGQAKRLCGLYNALIAYNTMASDLSTLLRIDNGRVDTVAYVNAFSTFRANFFTEDSLKPLLEKFAIILGSVASGRVPDDAITDSNTLFRSKFMEIYRREFDRYYNNSPADLSLAERPDVASFLDSVSDVEAAVCRSLPLDADAACLMLIEASRRSFGDSGRDSRRIADIARTIIESGCYSPLLLKVWLIWRTTVQIEIEGGRSNESPIFNAAYDRLRACVASTILRHIDSCGDSPLAFDRFMATATEPLIVRNSECLFGNNANLNEIDLYGNR